MQRCARTITAHPPLQLWPRILKHGSPHNYHPRRLQSTVAAASLAFGQPVHETHPHLLKSGELTPGITAQEYYDRRNALASKLPPGGIAVLAAADLKYKSKDVFYPYRQDSNFYYLTGFAEPSSLAIICRPTAAEAGEEHEFHLYVRGKNAKEEQWEGARSGIAAARDVWNADFAGDISSSNGRIKDLITSSSKVYTDIPSRGSTSSSSSKPSFLSRFTTTTTTTSSSSSSDSNNTLTSLLSTLFPSPLSPLIHSLRSLKSPAELSLLRRIGQASGRALSSAISQSFPSESTLSAHLSHQFHLHGLDGPAYVPVIAGGARGSCIHYTANNQLLNPGDTVLVDAGGESGGYVTDITRTWPVSGTFTPAQRDLYAAVLSVQRHCVSLCRANANITLDTLHQTAEQKLADNLSSLGFAIRGTRGKERMGELFPHHVGHYVGMDVHDTPTISRKETLKEGMVVSVEPGLYVPPEEGWWPARFRAMSVRIEDTVAVGEEGPVVCSAEAVKEVVDIEALRGSRV